MASASDLIIRLLVDDSDTSKISGAETKFEKFGSAMNVAAGIATGVLVAGAAAVTAAAMTVDEASDSIAGATGASGDALDGLVESAQNVSENVPTSLSAAADTISTLYQRLGITGETAETVAEQLLRLTDMGGQGAVDVDALTGALNLFNVSGDDASTVLDQFYGISQNTGVSVADLVSQVSGGGAQLSAWGFSVSGAATLLGDLSKAGIDSSGVLAAMKTGLVNLAKEGQTGQQAFSDVTTQIQGFVDAGDQASALDLASQIFGTRGASQFVAALETGAIDLDAITASASDTGQSILDMGNSTDDFPEKWQMFQSSITDVLAELGTNFMPILNGAVDGLRGFADWAGQNSGLVQALAIVLVVLAAAVIGVNVAMWLMAANPIVLLVAAIVVAVVLLIVAIVWLATNWTSVVAWITTIWNGFVSWIEAVLNGFVTWWNDLWTGFAGFITDTWNGFIGWITDNFNLFLIGLQIIGTAISNWWNGLWSGIGSFLTDTWSGAVGFVTDTFNNFLIGLQIIGTAISNWWNGLWSGIGSFFQGVWNGFGGFLKGVWNGMLSWIQSGVNGAIRILNGMISGLNNISGIIGIRFGTIPYISIPMLATGGIVTAPTLAMVGEAGPEAVVPLSQASSYGLGGGSGEVYVESVLKLDSKEIWRGVQKVQLREAF